MSGENPGCANSRCCQNEGADIPACYYYSGIILFTYDSDMDQINHPECWTGITRNVSETSETGCRTCDNGCDNFKDALGDLLGGSLWVGGHSYMRTKLNHRWGRNAKNQIFDLLTDVPMLVQRRCLLEFASCIDNTPDFHPDGWVCWGHHVCQCIDVDFSVEPGYPIRGLRPIHFFYNFQGWPPSTQGVAPGVELWCQQFWVDDPNDRAYRNIAVPVYQHAKNTAFLSEGMLTLGADKLAPCAGFRAPSTCFNEINGDCTYGPAARNVGVAIDTTTEHFDEVWIDVPNVDLKLRAKPTDTPDLVRAKQLYADVMAEIIGRTFIQDGTPNTVTMDRMSMFLPSNTYVGDYVRSWDGTTLDVNGLPTLIEFPHSYTRWGRVNVDARMVAVKARIKLYLALPGFERYVFGAPNDTWLQRHAYFEIDVETAMIVTPPVTTVTIGGEPLVVTQPEWLGQPGFDGIPTATPDGNRIVYARDLDASGRPLPVRVPRKWRWVGRLGSFSDPVVESTDFLTMNCTELVSIVGTFIVPGLATANEEYPNDPNQNYDGEIPFFFVAQP